MNVRWKKNPNLTGLAVVCSGPQGSKLHNGSDTLAWTGYSNGSFDKGVGWYWVSPVNSDLNIHFMNTCRSLVDTEQEAKQAAKAHIDDCLGKFI